MEVKEDGISWCLLLRKKGVCVAKEGTCGMAGNKASR